MFFCVKTIILYLLEIDIFLNFLLFNNETKNVQQITKPFLDIMLKCYFIKFTDVMEELLFRSDHLRAANHRKLLNIFPVELA